MTGATSATVRNRASLSRKLSSTCLSRVISAWETTAPPSGVFNGTTRAKNHLGSVGESQGYSISKNSLLPSKTDWTPSKARRAVPSPAEAAHRQTSR